MKKTLLGTLLLLISLQLEATSGSPPSDAISLSRLQICAIRLQYFVKGVTLSESFEPVPRKNWDQHVGQVMLVHRVSRFRTNDVSKASDRGPTLLIDHSLGVLHGIEIDSSILLRTSQGFKTIRSSDAWPVQKRYQQTFAEPAQIQIITGKAGAMMKAGRKTFSPGRHLDPNIRSAEIIEFMDQVDGKQGKLVIKYQTGKEVHYGERVFIYNIRGSELKAYNPTARQPTYLAFNLSDPLISAFHFFLY